MKKFYFLTLAALVALFSFTSCSDNDDENENPAEKSALAAPSLQVVDVTVEGFTVVWEAVANAANYTYEINGESHSTVNTQVQFFDLNPGNYTVRVKANPATDSKKYKSSAWASITATIEEPEAEEGECDWFTQSLYLNVYPEQNLDTTNSLFFTYKGTGVVALKMGIWPSDVVANETNETCLQYMQDMDAADVADINTAEGVTYFMGGLAPSTAYTLISWAKNEIGQTVFLRSHCTTEAAEENPLRDPWIGTWNARTTETLTWDVPAGSQKASFSFGTGTTDFQLTIEGDTVYPDQVLIYGLSSAIADAPAIGLINEEGNLEIHSGIPLSEADEDGYTPMWLVLCEKDGTNNFFIDEIPVYTFSLSGDQATSTVFSDSGYTARHMEIYAINQESSEMSFYAQDLPVTYKAGNITMSRASSTLNKAVKKATRRDEQRVWKRNTSFVVAL